MLPSVCREDGGVPFIGGGGELVEIEEVDEEPTTEVDNRGESLSLS